MNVIPLSILCVCGSTIYAVNGAGEFSCPNPACPNSKKVFRAVPIEVKEKSVDPRDTLYT